MRPKVICAAYETFWRRFRRSVLDLWSCPRQTAVADGLAS
uniref:Uncharacterized protein n=1 Tax=Arundo donax TaxID=35708 RepID=A0A0A8YHJ1_ARUDO